jgi:hypothetical protein
MWCCVCKNRFTILSHHLRLSPLCQDGGASAVITPRVPVSVTGVDDLVDAPFEETSFLPEDSSNADDSQEAPTFQDFEHSMPVPDLDPDADLDDDDYEMVFNDPSVVAATPPANPLLLLRQDPVSHSSLDSGRVFPRLNFIRGYSRLTL